MYPLNQLLPGTWGVSHGSGFVAPAIRRAEEEMSKSAALPEGDAVAAWAGHAFMYVGIQSIGPTIIEAEWPKVIVSPAGKHEDAIWAIHQPLAGYQRDVGVATAVGLLGHQYDALAYLYFINKVIHVAVTKDLRPLFVATDKIGPICSGVVVRSEEAMAVNIQELRTAAIQDPDFVSPADLLRWGLNNNWMSSIPPGA